MAAVRTLLEFMVIEALNIPNIAIWIEEAPFLREQGQISILRLNGINGQFLRNAISKFRETAVVPLCVNVSCGYKTQSFSLRGSNFKQDGLVSLR